MSATLHTSNTTDLIEHNPTGASSVVLVCEHANHHIPEEFDNLGMSPADLKSHAAWDPGAMAVALTLSKRLDAPLIASGVSRLVYDCNRPPSAKDAMPAQSEAIHVPGNENLTEDQRHFRTNQYYLPFSRTLSRTIAGKSAPVLVTIHSFTPVFHGTQRDVEIGVLHDADPRLADAMLGTSKAHTDKNVQRNEPYGPCDGVTHTLKEHALGYGHLNVMLEFRNDLIATVPQQIAMAEMTAAWIADACETLNASGVALCQA